MKTIRIDNSGQLRPQMEAAWYAACDAIKGGKIIVEIRSWSKSREMEKKYHAMINDIARQVVFYGKKRHKPEIWKALLVEQFAREKESMGEHLRHPGQTIVSLDGQRMITVRPSTTQFLVSEASDFIEYLYQQGTEFGVHWSEPALRVYQEYREARAA